MTASGANTYSWTPAAGLSNSLSANPTVALTLSTTYTATGTDVNGCKDTAVATATVNPLPVVSLTPQNASGCAPLCVNFTNTSAGTGTCFWDFGNGITSGDCTHNCCYVVQGTYHPLLTFTDNKGCTNTATAMVNVYPLPIADFTASPQSTTILYPHIDFTDASSGAVINSWSWLFGDPKDSYSVLHNPGFTYQDTGSYQVSLTVVSDHGCIDTAVKTIRIDDDFTLYVPNAFTPNADGTNEIFYAKGLGIKEFLMYIFDRWGNLIFTSRDINYGWNGTMQGNGAEICQEDVYVWKIEAKSNTEIKRSLTGTVSLVK
jgi:gliding motility-associated-like protein